MEKLEKFYTFVDGVLVVLVLFLEGQFLEIIKMQVSSSYWIMFLFTALTLIVLFELLGFWIRRLIERVGWMKRLILGPDYIEGTWFDSVVINGQTLYGLFTNTYESGKISQAGQQITASGQVTNEWTTLAADYHNHILSVLYQVRYYDDQVTTHPPNGISVISYHSASLKQSPTTFDGTFYDISAGVTASFRGFKIRDNAILRQLTDPEQQKEAIAALVKKKFLE